MLWNGGAEGIRTPDPHNAIVVLYQLSYDPIQSQSTLNDCRELSKKNAKLLLHGCKPDCKRVFSLELSISNFITYAP